MSMCINNFQSQVQMSGCVVSIVHQVSRKVSDEPVSLDLSKKRMFESIQSDNLTE